jgi:pyruvate dehydrogenase E2 component (dihydrolipoamide acetyltransferase)
MPKEFKLPDVGENVEKATVLSVSVKSGQEISKDDTVCEIETDKASLEVPSEISGTVAEVKISEDDEIAPGDVLFTIEDSEDDTSEKSDTEEKENPEDDTDDSEDQETEEKTSDKETSEKEEADTEKQKKEKSETEEQEKKENKKTGKKEKKSTKQQEKADAKIGGDSSGKSSETVPAAPSVRRFAREIGVDINQVKGSGENGRITTDDVKQHARGGEETSEKSTQKDDSEYGSTERKSMSGIRKTIASRLSQAWAEIPHVHHFDEAEISEIEASRKEYNAQKKDDQATLTVTAMLIQITARLLRQYPDINASIDMEASELIYHDYCHVGVAVDTDKGLLVPVIRDAERKCVREIADELTELSQKARDGKLDSKAMQGSTFTITNIGGIGGTQFTPIINPPNAAILGVSRARKQHVHSDNGRQEEMILPLVLGYDHRIVDGAQAARFMKELTNVLTRPAFSILFL